MGLEEGTSNAGLMGEKPVSPLLGILVADCGGCSPHYAAVSDLRHSATTILLVAAVHPKEK